jgi:hypothetical protein
MEGIGLNKTVIKTSLRIIRDLITTQSRARTRLLEELTSVCVKCDDAYDSLLTRLKPVRAAMKNPDKLAVELRLIAGDAAARKKFKPEKLCTEIEELLMDLSNNVNALKFSVNILTLSRLRGAISSMGNYDQALYQQYDAFMMEMNSVAQGIENGSTDERAALAAHAASSVDELQKSLQAALKEIRKAKVEALSLA